MTVSVRSGVRLHYVMQGTGDPPFVFIHGWCCDHTFFQPQFEHFSKTHAVFAPDLRGCGQSESPAEGYDIPTLADDVASLCRELGLAKSVFVGHSLGGMIAIELAARHPSLARAVVGVDPGPIDILPATRSLFEALIEALQGPDGPAVRQAYVEDMFLPTDDAERRRHIVTMMCSANLPMALAVLRGVVAWNGVGAMKLCTAPVLIITSGTGGSNDPPRLRALKADVEIGVTVGSGHFNMLDVPEQVTPMIEQFVKTLG
ncbi:MAG TPA: alpha/beta hydrolase [Candidatus Dormibacteraeota bacterium]|jgi:pimeloyl-ACP methyl ester carboxylesterase|nr:alpha/beta hydrolase [Candidatus Dormibacteraeota bacterium]